MKDYRVELEKILLDPKHRDAGTDELVEEIIALIKESLEGDREIIKHLYGNVQNIENNGYNQHRQEVKTNWGIK